MMPVGPQPPTLPRDERPTMEIVAELWENSETLLRHEVELGLVELDQRVERAKTDLETAAVGGAVLYAGVLALVAAVVLLLAKVMAPWVAAWIVGVAVAGAGFAMVQRGKKDLEHEATRPDSFGQSVRRTTHTLKEAVHDAAGSAVPRR